MAVGGGPYSLSPNVGFSPSTSNQLVSGGGASGKPPSATDATMGTLPWRQAGFPSAQLPRYPIQPQQDPSNTAVRPTNPAAVPSQASWLQNMATFAGGQLAPGQTGPVRRLVDVLGVQPFGDQNPMTLLMQALQNSGYGLGLPYGTGLPQWSPSNIPVGGSVGRPSPPGFNPYQMAQWT